jgi:iron complex transport system substrate-binding protein
MLALVLALLAADPTPKLGYLGPAPKRPASRVVTLAPSLTETVVALGARDSLVGVSRYDDLPEVKAVPRVGGFVDPSVEAVLAAHPDLLLVQPSPGNRAPIERLAQLGVPVLLLPLTTVEDTLAAVRAVGHALGKDTQGDALAGEIERTRADVRAKAAARPHPRVLFVFGYQPLVVAGPGSFAAELIADAGGQNVVAAAASPYPVYSVEQAMKDAPDIVVDASDTGGGERLMSLPGLASARWVKPPNLALLHPGPRLSEGLRQLFLLLHPPGKETLRK